MTEAYICDGLRTPFGRYGGALAIVDGRSLCRRAPGGGWSTIVTAEMNLSCCMAAGGIIYAAPLAVVESPTTCPESLMP